MWRTYENGEEKNTSTCSFSSVKALLATGLLEGVFVTYKSKKYRVELDGYIKGDGYKCGCSTCNFSQVLSAYEFERHARATSNHPNNHIRLKNGKTLHEVVKHVIKFPIESLCKELEAVTGCQINSNLYSAQTNELSHMANSEVKQMSHEEKQTKGDSKIREESILPNQLEDFAAHFWEPREKEILPKKIQNLAANIWKTREDSKLLKQFEDLVGYQTDSSSDSLGNRLLEGANCELEEIPSNEVKQTGVDDKAHQKVSVKFTQLLPLNASFGQYNTSEDSLVRTPPRFESKRYYQEPKKSSQGNKRELVSFNLLQNVVADVREKKKKAEEDFPRKSRKRLKKEVDLLKKGNLDVRTLLATGFLEGLSVKYKKDTAEVDGFIKDQGYQCGCPLCNYTKVVSALKFETHAGGTSNNQNNHIFLQCGISLYALVKKLSNVPLDSIGKEIEKTTGCAINRKHFDRKGLVEATNDNFKETQQIQAVELHSDPHLDKSVIFAVSDMEYNVNQASNVNNNVTFPSNTEGLKARSDILRQTSSVISKNSIKEITVQRKRSFESNAECRKASPLNTRVRFNSPLPHVEENTVPSPHIGTKVSSTWPDKEGNTYSDSPTMKDPMIETTAERKKRLPASPKLLEYNVQQNSATQGGNKKRTGDLHRIIFTENALQNGDELFYRSNGQAVLKGFKKDNGIFCDCCKEVISPSKFEAHAGFSAKRQPYRSIYTSSGISLHEFTMDFLSRHKVTSTCTKCGGGGDTVSCDGCSKVFHEECMSLPGEPGDCHRHCLSCKENIDSEEPSRTRSSSAAKPVNLDLTRVRKRQRKTGCALCEKKIFDLGGEFGSKSYIFCGQCQKLYHVGCLKDHNICDLKVRPSHWTEWFCSEDCKSISILLEKVLLLPPIDIPRDPLTILKRRFKERGLTIEDAPEFKWRLLSGARKTPDSDRLLSKATAIFQEAFGPITEDEHDLIPAMVAGQQEFAGMHCVVLTENSEIVSAGLLRVFGTHVAELPLVATSKEYRGKGYFQTLLAMIEWLMCVYEVKLLVLPVDEDAQSIWINKLGYGKMNKERVVQYAKEHWLVRFEKKTMLEKAESDFHKWV